MQKETRYFYQPQPIYTLIFWSWNVVLLSLVFIIQLEQFKLNWYTPVIAIIYIAFTLTWLIKMHINVSAEHITIYRFAHHQIVFPLHDITINKQGKWKLIIHTHSLNFGDMTLLLFPKYRDRLYAQLINKGVGQDAI